MRLPHRTPLVPLLVILISAGCRAAPTVPPTDAKIRQQAEAGEVAYAEGNVELAMRRYRGALHRAWSLDDPLEAAHASHNLAACLTSSGDYEQGRAWVREARREFERARQAAPDSLLLEAKIARKLGAYDDAWQLAAEAEQQVQCCAAAPALCPPGPKSCDCQCVQWYQVRKYREQKKVLQRKANTVQAEVHLVRALLASDLGDLATAREESCLACELLPDVCEPELQAEWQHVMGLIHRLEGRPDLAARHFDVEAELLREAGNYREIPQVLGLAASDYEQVGLPGLAADRWYRVARIAFARGELEQAAERLRYGLALAETSGDPEVQDRYALLFHELHAGVSKNPDMDHELKSPRTSATPGGVPGLRAESDAI